MLLNDFVKLKENKTTNNDFKEILKDFLPVAKKILNLEQLPKIILKKHIAHGDQPTQGRFHNEAYTLELAIADRHPVDILRTLAHELVHAKQQSEHVDIDPTTGSDDENEANMLAGIIMREFNKQFPEYLETKPISEGGNLQLPGGHEAQHIDLKVTNRSVIVPILNQVLNAISNGYARAYKEPLWDPKLLQSGKFLSGSSLHFFNVKGIPDEQFVAKKPKVGDIDTQVDRDKVENLTNFLNSVQGKTLGPATLLGYQKGNEQYSSLWELTDVPIKVQIDLEFVEYTKGEPTPWAQFSHSSSWEDLQAGVKGVFHKFLIQSLPVLGRKEFLLRKLVGRGKARAEQDVPTEDNMVSFAVSSKEGGGLRAKYEPVLDDQGLPLIKDGLQVMRALPPEGYEQDIDQIFLTLFGDRIGPKQAAALSKNYWSFTGLLDVMNQLLSPEEKSAVADGFIKKLFAPGAQGLYRGEPDRDAAEKTAALDLMFKTLQIEPPADLEQMKADYKSSYKVAANESFLREAPDYKRQGIKHIYNPGSSTEMKDLEFVEMAKEIAANGGTLDGMAVNLKADGAGIRFGKDQSGQPFFMTSKVTEPKYLDNYGDFERYATEMGASPDRIDFAKNYDEALHIILNSKFMDALPADTIVQAEMMYNPMAKQTKDGLQFVNIPYDPKKLGKTMTLVPFMFKQYSTGEALPNAQEIKKNLLAASDANVKLVDNQLKQQGVDVSKIIDPVVNMDPDLLHALSSRTRVNPDKEAAKEIINKARQELSDAIINSPAISGKDALGANIEGLVINLPSGRLAKVTSPMMKSSVAAKVAQARQQRQGKGKTAVVAIGSFVGHVGHEQLWDYTLKKAAEVGGDPYLFIGQGVGKDDPIPPAVKVQTWHRLYPEYKNNISTVNVAGGSLMQKIKHELINPQPGQPPKYDNIIIMVGEDQAKMNIAQALMKAVNKFPGYEHVNVQLEVTPRGTGMSFTKLRNILKDPNATPEQQYQVWAQGFDEKKLGRDYILHLMDVARKGMGIQQPQPKVAERLFNSLMNIGAAEAREPKPTVVVPGGDNPDAPHVPIKGDVPVKRGDLVLAQDPDNIATVFTGRVKRVGRTHVFIIKRNGEEIAVPHDQVSKDYDVLSRQAHKILNKKGKNIGNYSVDEYQDRMAGVGMGNYVVDKNASVEEGQINELDVKSTLNFIKKAHGDQLYGDKPYFTHPKAVAATGKKFFGNKFSNDAIKVAFLHDVVEDTNFSIEQLSKMGFSPEVVEAVSLLTKNKALSYADNIKAIINSGNRLAMMVKYADNYQNFTGDKSDFDPERADRLQKKYLASLDLLGAKLGINKHIGTPQAGTDRPTDEAMLPKSAFAGSNKNKLGPAAHLTGKMKRPARQGDLVGGSAEESVDPCWKGYKQIGMKKKGGKQVPNCVPKESVEETKKLSTAEKLNRGLKRGGYDADAAAKKIKDIQDRLAQQEKQYRAQGTLKDENFDHIGTGKMMSKESKQVPIGESWENKIASLVEKLAKK